jgi:hypothetical protein
MRPPDPEHPNDEKDHGHRLLVRLDIAQQRDDRLPEKVTDCAE